MKKSFIFCVVLLILSACGGFIKNENGSEFITKLDSEPNDCTYLYKIESNVSVYNADDARRYLENTIADQETPGNAYFITDQKKKPSAKRIIFGPENTFVLTANVYDCPRLKSAKTVSDSAK